jgi:hypothetical protein
MKWTLSLVETYKKYACKLVAVQSKADVEVYNNLDEWLLKVKHGQIK